jgi:hypothetical protein
MRLGKRERKALELKATLNRLQDARASVLHSLGGSYASSCDYLTKGKVITGSSKPWDYNGKNARRLTSKGRTY